MHSPKIAITFKGKLTFSLWCLLVNCMRFRSLDCGCYALLVTQHDSCYYITTHCWSQGCWTLPHRLHWSDCTQANLCSHTYSSRDNTKC